MISTVFQRTGRENKERKEPNIQLYTFFNSNKKKSEKIMTVQSNETRNGMTIDMNVS